MTSTERQFTSIEICAGAGGQAVGLHNAKFKHLALLEIDEHAVATLERNVTGNPQWSGCKVLHKDLTKIDLHELRLQLGLERGNLSLLAGGVPCPPFSVAGKQLGEDDDRDLFPKMLEMVDEFDPKAVMIENVRGLMDAKFEKYRNWILGELDSMGYKKCFWGLLEAKDYGVPQLRPRSILVAMKPEGAKHFRWVEPELKKPKTVADALWRTMRKRFQESGHPGWESAYKEWFKDAKKGVAPTLVGGSKKHGGADLGPTRAKKAWANLGVCGLGVANDPEEMTDPGRDLFAKNGPKLTVAQAAIIQGFPQNWHFEGKKTAAYRQVGNAFPPPVAEAVGRMISAALKAEKEEREAARSEDIQPVTELPVQSALFGAEAADFSDDLQSAVAG
ncbi:DNA cytosine methyltransferase [Streptomyces sp. NBC_00286]|uniref:DNA cytosine methyltransferase n=1 Tax=Streptomyces sp. NBC_00286 TaxID=2975701 RepID=UPI002E28A08B|nr:DNA (cytosine-5-)-methyltransferase [Streptomyces sp. NBC_00286]